MIDRVCPRVRQPGAGHLQLLVYEKVRRPMREQWPYILKNCFRTTDKPTSAKFLVRRRGGTAECRGGCSFAGAAAKGLKPNLPDIRTELGRRRKCHLLSRPRKRLCEWHHRVEMSESGPTRTENSHRCWGSLGKRAGSKLPDCEGKRKWQQHRGTPNRVLRRGRRLGAAVRAAARPPVRDRSTRPPRCSQLRVRPTGPCPPSPRRGP
jgi:hypothetical protein